MVRINKVSLIFSSMSQKSEFLPTTIAEGRTYYGESFDQFDLVFVTGDPYYDHPLSGVAILSRLLDSKGYRVGIIGQPFEDSDYTVCGRPKYFFCITSGLLDSSLANYTPMLREREDVLVPPRALQVYTSKVKGLYKGVMTVLGGVEATIRRFTQFDYVSNSLRRGILNDSKADLLLHGNAERSLLVILERLKKLEVVEKNRYKNDRSNGWKFVDVRSGLDLFSIEGVAFRVKAKEISDFEASGKHVRKLPSYEDCLDETVVDGGKGVGAIEKGKQNFSLLTRVCYLLPDDSFIEGCGAGFILHTRPAHTLTSLEMDLVYNLPFTRKLHPGAKNYDFAQRMVKNLSTSVIIGRGCWGSCNFCVIPLVQGKEVAVRSVKSIVSEIEKLYLSGVDHIADLTLPTLNMYGSKCSLYDTKVKVWSPILEKDVDGFDKKKYCNQECAGCPKRVLSDNLYELLVEIEKLQAKFNVSDAKSDGVEIRKNESTKTLELRSAIRHDVILDQKKLFRKIMQFVNRLKIAPEHISDKVLSAMNKGVRAQFEEFLLEYAKVQKEQGTTKNLVPYFVVAHPGCDMSDMEILKKFCSDRDIYVNLTQVFTPTPGTASTAMYYTGLDKSGQKKIHVARGFRSKKDQKRVLLPMVKGSHRKDNRNRTKQDDDESGSDMEITDESG